MACLDRHAFSFIYRSAVLGLSALIDRLFYGIWTFPVLKFLYVNVAQSIAIFYGHNDWHYYLSQGYPLLLTTALPFGIFGLYRSLRPDDATPRRRRTSIKFQLATMCLVMPAVLSIIAHKEVRFIYPLLPALHILTAEPLVSFSLPVISSSSNVYLPRRLTLVFLVLVNVFIAYYTTLVHAPGPLDTLSYLRGRHEVHQQGYSNSLAPHPIFMDSDRPVHDTAKNMTVGFLMPCHSTPWRSHLVYPSIEAWALSCEPPLGLNETQKKVYLDEADQFYANPTDFLQHHMIGGLWHVPRRPSYMSIVPPRTPISAYNAHQRAHPLKESTSYHEWPDYLVFFGQLEPTIRTALRSSSYDECWRTWNTAWHDDWRRKGDVVVWCLDPNEQQEWRKVQHQQHAEHRERQFDRLVSRFEKRKQAKTNRYNPINFFRGLSATTPHIATQNSWFSSLPWPFSSPPSKTSPFSVLNKKPSYLPSWLTDPFSTHRRYKYIPNFIQDQLPARRSLYDPRSWFPSTSWPFSAPPTTSWSSWWPWDNKKSKKTSYSAANLERDRGLWE